MSHERLKTRRHSAKPSTHRDELLWSRIGGKLSTPGRSWSFRRPIWIHARFWVWLGYMAPGLVLVHPVQTAQKQLSAQRDSRRQVDRVQRELYKFSFTIKRLASRNDCSSRGIRTTIGLWTVIVFDGTYGAEGPCDCDQCIPQQSHILGRHGARSSLPPRDMDNAFAPDSVRGAHAEDG